MLSILNGEMELAPAPAGEVASFHLLELKKRKGLAADLAQPHMLSSCTALAMESAVDPVSLTLSKVTFGRSSSSLSLLICLGDRPRGSICALTWLLPSSNSGTTIVLFIFPGDLTAV